MEEFGEYGFFVKLDEENINNNIHKGICKNVNIMTQINEDELLYNKMEMEMEMEMDMEMDMGMSMGIGTGTGTGTNNLYTLIIEHIKYLWVIFKFLIRER